MPMSAFMMMFSVVFAVMLLIMATVAVPFAVIAWSAVYSYRTVSTFRYDYYARTLHVPDRRIIVVGFAIDDSGYANRDINVDSCHGCR